VTQSVPPYTVVAGNPARILRALDRLEARPGEHA
jgi:acetyltransferase-like isoleucine patch superfamily enzyme